MEVQTYCPEVLQRVAGDDGINVVGMLGEAQLNAVQGDHRMLLYYTTDRADSFVLNKKFTIFQSRLSEKLRLTINGLKFMIVYFSKYYVWGSNLYLRLPVLVSAYPQRNPSNHYPFLQSQRCNRSSEP